MENKKNDWILTDDDCFQICRKVKDGVYELYQVTNTLPSWKGTEKAFGVSHAIIDLETADIGSICECYSYPSLDKIKDWYGDGWEQIIAECAFELDALDCVMRAPLMSYGEAKNWIVKKTGFYEEFDSVNQMVVETPLGNLVAYPSTDPEHPGIYIDLHRDGEDADASLTLVEYTDDDADETKKIITRVWGDTKKEDYTVAVDHKGIGECFRQADSR